MNNKHHISAISLTNVSRLAQNTLWNIFGMVLPLIVGVIAIPFLLKGLGTERFGILTILWMVIGYFNIFDFGLGRALTKLVAEKLGQKKYDDIPSLIWTALIITFLLSIISALVVFCFADILVQNWLKISPKMQSETLTAFKIMAFSVPFVVVTTGFRAVLEAYQRFRIINIIRVPLGLITFLGPLAVLPFSISLDVIVIVLLIGRIIGTCIYFHYFLDTVPIMKQGFVLRKDLIRPLFCYGGWMTVSNLLAPLIVYIDRFLIGSVLTMVAVAYYVAPYEIVTRLSFLPMALISVLFPAFSTLLTSDKNKAASYFTRGSNIILFIMFSAMLVVVALAPEGIEIWLGDKFVEKSSTVLQWLAVGVFINSVGSVPFVFIQGAGRPDIPAKLYFFELPIYVAAVYASVKYYGIVGVAVVWTLRVAIDTFVFLWYATYLVPEASPGTMKIVIKTLVGVSVLLTLISIDNFMIRLVILLGLLAAYFYSEWKWGLEEEERTKLLSIPQKLRDFL